MKTYFNFFLKLADNTLRMISALFTEVWKMRQLINLIVCEKQCKWWGLDCFSLTVWGPGITLSSGRLVLPSQKWWIEWKHSFAVSACDFLQIIMGKVLLFLGKTKNRLKTDDHQVSAVTQSCPTLCDPMNHSTPGLPVHHRLPEFTQTHVHWVGDAIQPSHSLSSPSPPAPNSSQHQSLFQWVNSSNEVAKVLEFQP